MTQTQTIDIKKLTTPRLLAYYKKRRPEFKKMKNSVECDICGKIDCDCYIRSQSELKSVEEYKILSTLMTNIKDELSSREHVSK